MERLPLSPNLSQRRVVTERSQHTVLYSEICSRLLEDMEAGEDETRAFAFIAKLYAIGTIDPEAFRMVIALTTGDLSQITYTYSQLGKARHRSKQAQQQCTERVIRALKLHFPHLANVIVEIRHITAEINPAKPHEHTRQNNRRLVSSARPDAGLYVRDDVEEVV